ncbi:MAG: hypothetical protein JWO46_1949 [Nocardioidaceae bacterium]|nr:hypothetical protein [Nocardioidaceae bacterium]
MPPDHPGDYSGDPTPASPYSRWHTPAPLAAAAGLTFLEGLVTTLLGVAEAFNTRGGALVMGATTAVFFAAYGVALMVCAWGMNRSRSWSRGPVLLAQLIWLGMAWSFRGSPTTVFAVVLAVVAVLVLAGMLQPASLDALNRSEEPDEEA